VIWLRLRNEYSALPRFIDQPLEYTTSATDVAILTLALILLLQRLCGVRPDGDFGAVQGPGPWDDVRPAATRVVPSSRRDEMARPMLADGR